jgi:hypothetical protein
MLAARPLAPLHELALYWILAAVLVLLTLTVPRLRIAGLVGCVILVGLLVWGMTQRLADQNPDAQVEQQRGQPRPAVARIAVPLTSIELTGMKLSGGGAPFDLRGQVTNGTRDTLLKSFTLQVKRKDCYEDALDPSGCETIWQDRHRITISVAPQQTRAFASAIWAHSAVPRQRGTLKDEFVLTAAAGDPFEQ